MRYEGKPTTYAGIEFRSRLEARWAAFFDLVQWSWEYEPEVEGRYIPDFLIHGVGSRQIYVEVKPLDVYLGNRKAIIAKAQSAIGSEHPLLILTGDFQHAICFDNAALGLFADSEGDGSGDDFAMLFQPGAHRFGLEYDLGEAFGSWRGKLTGAYEGNALYEGTLVSKADLLKLWSRAGNAIQWKPKVPRP